MSEATGNLFLQLPPVFEMVTAIDRWGWIRRTAMISGAGERVGFREIDAQLCVDSRSTADLIVHQLNSTLCVLGIYGNWFSVRRICK